MSRSTAGHTDNRQGSSRALAFYPKITFLPQAPRIKAAAPDVKDTLAAVTSVVQSVLGFAPAPEQPLMEAGLDSLGAVELRNALGSRFGIPDLPATLTFDYATTAALAGFIAGEAARKENWQFPQCISLLCL